MKNSKVSTDNKLSNEKKISRKEAIKKTGITALTVASLTFMATKASAGTSTPANPGSGWPTS